jgi:hypothetical protein
MVKEIELRLDGVPPDWKCRRQNAKCRMKGGHPLAKASAVAKAMADKAVDRTPTLHPAGPVLRFFIFFAAGKE